VSCDGPGGFLKESGATGYAQGGERCYGSLDNGVQNLLPGIFVLKDLFFSVIPDKDEESVGIKTIAFRFFTLFRTTVLFQKGRSLQKHRFISE